jgi:hypothetical protein
MPTNKAGTSKPDGNVSAVMDQAKRTIASLRGPGAYATSVNASTATHTASQAASAALLERLADATWLMTLKVRGKGRPQVGEARLWTSP